jgi:hypothetical protein
VYKDTTGDNHATANDVIFKFKSNAINEFVLTAALNKLRMIHGWCADYNTIYDRLQRDYQVSSHTVTNKSKPVSYQYSYVTDTTTDVPDRNNAKYRPTISVFDSLDVVKQIDRTLSCVLTNTTQVREMLMRLKNEFTSFRTMLNAAKTGCVSKSTITKYAHLIDATMGLATRHFVDNKCDISMKRAFIKVLCAALEVLLRLIFCEPSPILGKHVAKLNSNLYASYRFTLDDGAISPCGQVNTAFNTVVSGINCDVDPSNTAIICMTPGSHYPSLVQRQVGTANVSFSYIVWVGLKMAFSNISRSEDK